MSKKFEWPDYLILGLMLSVSAVIGFFHGCRKGGQKTTDDYLMGGRNMGLLPVAFSVLASFLSAISVLAVPVEVYLFGASFWVNSLSYFISVPITAHVFIPLFHRLKLRSVYEYLELRFSYSVRVLGCLTFTLQMVVYMAVVFYAPALVFSQVSGLYMWVSLLVTGVICTVYTTLGGLKAVVWTDVFQMFVVISGLLALIIRGTMEVGGVSAVWEKATEGGRLEHVFDFDPDPLKRHTFWSLVFGGSVTTLSVYAINQALVQRYLAVKKLSHAQGTIYFNLPSNIITTTLLVGLGLVTYARYKGCDPLKSGKVTKMDQLIPLLVMDTLSVIPGMAGLFISCVFSAALSTVSSGVNALALVHLEDIAKPVYKTYTGTTMSDRLSTVVSKCLAMFFGLLTVGLAFLAGLLGRTMLQITLSSFGMTGGPLLGLFLLAIFVPVANTPIPQPYGSLKLARAQMYRDTWLVNDVFQFTGPNSFTNQVSRYNLPRAGTVDPYLNALGVMIHTFQGAIAGLVTSLVYSFWVAIGAIVRGPRPQILNINTDDCAANIISNVTYVTTPMTSLVTNASSMYVDMSTSPTTSPAASSLSIYRLSYMWYSGSAVIVAILVGTVVSLLTGGLTQEEVNPNLVINVWRKMKSFVSRDSQQYNMKDKEEHAKLNPESHYIPESASP